jgi:hypothetical protein
MSAKAAYRTSPTRRRRRTQDEMEAIRQALYETLAEGAPMTVRQVFYALTVQGVVAKTEAEYKGTVCRLLAEMRKAQIIPYTWLADATRWQRKPQTFSSVESALRRTAQTYRRALWDDAPVGVELWLEKEALAGVLVDVTDEWDVPLMVTRGCPSLSFLYSAAEQIADRFQRNGQCTRIYYFGDRDPTGVDIDRQVVEGIDGCLQALSGGALPFEHAATFERVAVTVEQIEEWQLPSRPTKKSDSRSRTFQGESVELDAIPPEDLRELARDVIRQHVDLQQLAVLEKTEQEERRVLERLVTDSNGNGGTDA